MRGFGLLRLCVNLFAYIIESIHVKDVREKLMNVSVLLPHVITYIFTMLF